MRWRWMMPIGRRNSGAIRRMATKRAGFGFRPDRRLGQNADARADLHRLLDGLDIIEFHDYPHVYAALAEVAFDLLADAQVAIESRQNLRLAGVRRSRLCGEVSGCCGGQTTTIFSDRKGITFRSGDATG